MVDAIYDTLLAIFERSDKEKLSQLQVADRMAEEIIYAD